MMRQGSLSRHEESTQQRENNEGGELSYHRKLTFGVADVHGARMKSDRVCHLVSDAIQPAKCWPLLPYAHISKERRPLRRAVSHAQARPYRSSQRSLLSEFANVTEWIHELLS